ncbi:hypothetical protein FACS18948_2120 [Clostridia bacterium]|nr:hypothetical protein FACS18948_2120 [Clostridia bacterium]
MIEATWRECVGELLNRGKQLNAQKATDYIFGMKIVYSEVLGIILSNVIPFEEDFGLNIDIDRALFTR